MTPPKMPIHIGDYKRDTGHLRAAEHGAYLLLLFHHWSTGALPDDDRQLSAIACMTSAEWKRSKPIIQKFFKAGWVHSRVLSDLEEANASYERRARAGKEGGKAKANGKQCSSNATAMPEQPITDNLAKKDSEANASGAEAPRDFRAELFGRGLRSLATMTGKGPDACRSFVGKCLKAAGDDAVTVLGLIEDAERNQVVDPSAWIAARLKGPDHAKPKSSVIQAADNLRAKLASFDGRAGGQDGLRGGEGAPPPRLLSHG